MTGPRADTTTFDSIKIADIHFKFSATNYYSILNLLSDIEAN